MPHAHEVETSFNLTLVALSYVIAVFGSFTALQFAARIRGAEGRAFWGWLLGAATALGGCAIWSMHFIGMLAFQMAMPMSYDPFLTVVSLAVGIGAAALGLFVVGRGAMGVGRLLVGGFFAGLAVAGMHYTGMAAMRMSATISYDPLLFALSLVIAVVAAIAALWLAFNLKGAVQMLGSAFVMGVAVCGMHYTGMAAAIYTPTAEPVTIHTSAVSADDMALLIFVGTALVLSVGLVVAFATRREKSLLVEA